MTIFTNSPDPFNDGSLVAKYMLNGNMNDVTGRYDGSNPNGLSFVDGKFGSCIKTVDGNYGALSGTFQSLYDFTVSFWVIGSESFAIGDSWGKFALHQHVTVGQFFVGTDVATRALINSNEMNYSSWNHIVVAISGGNMKVYINDTLVTDKSVTPSSGMSKLVLGTHDVTAVEYSGSIDQVEIYNRALTHSEVSQLFTQSESDFDFDSIIIIPVLAGSVIWSNKETKAQANPYPPAMQNVKPVEPVATLLGKSGNYQSLLNQKGEQRKTGYITGTVKQEQIPVAKRVLLFTQAGFLTAETKSDKWGNYRFDHLLLENKYMITAQAGHEPNSPPDFHPDTVGYISATPYQ